MMMGGVLAAGVSALGTAAMAATSGKLTEAEYQKLSAAPKTPADHRALAKYYRAAAADHDAEAKAYEALAATYAKGLPGATEGHAHELSRTIKHAAEHSRDFAEALRDIADVHDGIAQGPVG
jgi:hypothetical protein